jgi:hypothetical protein
MEAANYIYSLVIWCYANYLNLQLHCYIHVCHLKLCSLVMGNLLVVA